MSMIEPPKKGGVRPDGTPCDCLCHHHPEMTNHIIPCCQPPSEVAAISKRMGFESPSTRVTRKFSSADVMLARVLKEDNDFIILEVVKDVNKTIHLFGGEQFHRILFTEGKPWERKKA